MICYGSLAALVALLIGAFVIAPARAAAGGAGGGRPGGAEQPEQRQAPPDGAAGGGSRAAGAPRARIRADAGTSPYCSWNQLYLPQIARPDHYDLRLATDLRSAPFEVTGSVRIRLAPVSEVTPCLVVHSKGPNIKSARLIVGDEVAGDFISGTRARACAAFGKARARAAAPRRRAAAARARHAPHAAAPELSCSAPGPALPPTYPFKCIHTQFTPPQA